MKYDVWLCDDGTMDTVVKYTCPDCGETHEFRYCASDRDYRSRTTGAFTDRGWRTFVRDVVIPDIESDECPFVDSIGDDLEPAWNGLELDGAP